MSQAGLPIGDDHRAAAVMYLVILDADVTTSVLAYIELTCLTSCPPSRQTSKTSMDVDKSLVHRSTAQYPNKHQVPVSLCRSLEVRQERIACITV